MSKDEDKKKKEERPERAIVVKGKSIPISSIITLFLGLAAYILSRILLSITSGATITVSANNGASEFMLSMIVMTIASFAPLLFILGVVTTICGLFFKSWILKVAQATLIVADFILLISVFMYK